MSWKKEVNEICNRKSIAENMGGAKSIERHHSSGKLTVRERIASLLDPFSFQEKGALTGAAEYGEDGELKNFTPANVVIGKGRINQRKVVVSGEDFTIRAGSSEATCSDKWIWAEKLAEELKIPLIRLVDTAGGSIKILKQAGATKIPGYPGWKAFGLLGHVPVVAAALGSTAGLGALRVVASHFCVMVKEKSQVFAAGPYVVKSGLNQEIDKEALGGYRVHTRGSGVVDNEAEDELDALNQIKQFLSFLPQNVYQIPPKQETEDDPARQEEELLHIIPRDKKKIYNARKILELIFDRGSLFEIGRYQGQSTITMLGRLNGYPVGVIACDPSHMAGSMTSESAEKFTRFVDMCDTFHLPIVNFMDQPGVMIGLDAEQKGSVRKGARVLAAIEQSTTPWVAIFIKKAYGMAAVSYGRLQGINMRYAWPSAVWGSLPVEGGVEAAYKKDIQSSADPKARMQELKEEYHKLTSPFRTAERFGVTDIIDPRETRSILCDWVEDAYEVIPQLLGPVYRSMRC